MGVLNVLPHGRDYVKLKRSLALLSRRSSKERSKSNANSLRYEYRPVAVYGTYRGYPNTSAAAATTAATAAGKNQINTFIFEYRVYILYIYILYIYLERT